MPVKIEVRLATIEDASVLADLNHAFNGVVELAGKLAARLEDARRLDFPILAEINGQAVGYACLRLAPCVFYPETYAELTELYVEQGWRKLGVGKALVGFAEALALQSGARELVLLTSFNNQVGQRFYRSAGYNPFQLAMNKKLS
jgi:GNAT superfamily N-acetyltransferase